MKTYGQDGEKLAKAYCQSCHVLPSPTELDKSTWVSKVFPVMRQYMGLEPLAQHDILPHDLKAIFPTLPMMTEDEWFTVAQWYIDNAPAELPAPPPVSISGTTGVFTSTPIVRSDVIPMTTFVHYDTSRRSIVLGDGMTNAVHLTNVDGRILQSIQIPGPPSAIAVRNDRWYITNMGKLRPHDSAVGSLVEITWDGSAAKTRVVLDSLRRPTHVIVEDLNGDGRPDFLICEYGNLIGQFGWYEVLRNGKIVYHQLSPLPGALRAIVRARLGDGRRWQGGGVHGRQGDQLRAPRTQHEQQGHRQQQDTDANEGLPRPGAEQLRGNRACWCHGSHWRWRLIGEHEGFNFVPTHAVEQGRDALEFIFVPLHVGRMLSKQKEGQLVETDHLHFPVGGNL